MGLEVDAFLAKTLPELLEAEFTAQMEDKLDAHCEADPCGIATGGENWERYIIGWNEGYLTPALEKAIARIERMPRADKLPPKGSPIAQGKEAQIICTQCGQEMTKVPSPSKKLHRDHFLKCSGSQTVMFYNKWHKTWEKNTENFPNSTTNLK